jgi:putative ABC transport system ATP-binding protein
MTEAGGSVPPILRGRNLTRAYRLGTQRVPALSGLDIDCEAAEFTALEGPSGSGKTTLLNLLGLLDRPDGGSILLDGEDSAALDEKGAPACASTGSDSFSDVQLIRLTARENVEIPDGAGGNPDREREGTLALAPGGRRDRREGGRRPDLLSGGQRQRVAIARALANHPKSCSPTSRPRIWTATPRPDPRPDAAVERGASGGFLFATHDPRVVERARRVIVLRDGAIARNDDEDFGARS